jgi:hypothetical protein
MKRQQGSSSTLQSNGSKPGAKVVRKQTHGSTQAALIPIVTSDEIFADGTAIELVRQIGEPERASLLYWDGVRDTIAPIVQRKGRSYVPPRIDPSILRELILPTHSSSAGSTRDLLMELGKQSVHFIGLPEKFASIVARMALDNWIIGALSVAPVLTITGPDVSRGNRPIEWFHCGARHALRMTGVTPARLSNEPALVHFRRDYTASSLCRTSAEMACSRLEFGALRPNSALPPMGARLENACRPVSS